MRLFASTRIVPGLRAGVSAAPHELARTGTLGGWFKHELTRWDQGALWLLLIWKAFVLGLAILVCGAIAALGAGVMLLVMKIIAT